MYKIEIIQQNFKKIFIFAENKTSILSYEYNFHIIEVFKKYSTCFGLVFCNV